MIRRAREMGFAGLGSSLVGRFVAGAALTIAAAMAILAYAISDRIAASLMHRTAEDGGMLIDTMLGPLVQELAASSRLAPETIKKLDAAMSAELAGSMKSIKIWLRDGTIVYSNNKELIGQKFSSPRLDAAFAGKATGSFDKLDDPEHRHERSLSLPLIEIYAPLYQTGTDRIIAVGEFYTSGEKLAEDLRAIRFTAILIVGIVAAPMMLVLFFMVRRAGAVVKSHQDSLTQKMFQAQQLAQQNDQLRRTADEARLEAARSNEKLLDQIGQDLHDGPVQLLSLLMLKLTESDAGTPGNGKTADATLGAQELAARILQEVRDISAGLVLPQLEGLTATEIVRLAVRQHEHITGTEVSCRVGSLPDNLCRSSSICLFRLVQEGLNNAFQHAKGRGQEVEASADQHWVTVVVRDSGTGGATHQQSLPRSRTGLGLAGLRRRIEALRGTFEVSFQNEKGSEIRARLPRS